MTNIQKALELINTFATGDTEKAADLLAEGYIQHNLAYGTGRDAFVGSVQYLASAPVKTTVNNIRAYEDGDKVFLHTVYNFAGAGEQVAFDIFRFDENGKIAEHWDNLAAKAAPNPSGRTQIDNLAAVKDLDKTEENRQIVKDFLHDVMMGKAPEKTPDYFDNGKYIQHNTGIADGLDGLGAALAALAEQGIPFDRKKFSPHITLIRNARYKSGERIPVPALPECGMEVPGVSLMKSERGRNGMVYTQIRDND